MTQNLPQNKNKKIKSPNELSWSPEVNKPFLASVLVLPSVQCDQLHARVWVPPPHTHASSKPQNPMQIPGWSQDRTATVSQNMDSLLFVHLFHKVYLSPKCQGPGTPGPIYLLLSTPPGPAEISLKTSGASHATHVLCDFSYLGSFMIICIYI